MGKVRWEANNLKKDSFVAKITSELMEKERKNDYQPKSFLLNYYGEGKKEKQILSDVSNEMRKLIVNNFEDLKKVIIFMNI